MVHSLRPTMQGWWPWSWHPSKDWTDRQLPFHFHHSRTPNRRTIRLHTTVNYVSVLLFIISLFSLYTVKHTYRWKNEPVKLNSALKNTNTDLQTRMKTQHSSGAITGMEGTCCSPTSWSQMPPHRCIIKKTVMDPWPAPYQNSHDYWCCTYDGKISGRNFHQTSVNLTVSTWCYTNGPYKEGDLQTNLRCCFHHPAKLHSFYGGESVPSMMCLHTC
jgi:hypothetical protein